MSSCQGTIRSLSSSSGRDRRAAICEGRHRRRSCIRTERQSLSSEGCRADRPSDPRSGPPAVPRSDRCSGPAA
jgi:hypothetical protein